MASYGFESINANGDVQITEDFANYRVYQTGSVAVNNAVETVTISLSPARNKIPLLAIAPGTDFWVGPVELRRNSSGQYTAFVFRKRPDAGVSGTLYYAILDSETIGTLASTEAYGLQVFDASGSAAFDSRERYLHVLGVVSAKFDSVGTVYSYSQPSVARAYYLMSAIAGRWVALYPGTGELDSYEPLVRQVSSTSFETTVEYIGTNIDTTTGNGVPSPQSVIVCTVSD